MNPGAPARLILGKWPLKMTKSGLISCLFGLYKLYRERQSQRRSVTESTQSWLLLAPGQADASTQRRGELPCPLLGVTGVSRSSVCVQFMRIIRILLHVNFHVFVPPL